MNDDHAALATTCAFLAAALGALAPVTPAAAQRPESVALYEQARAALPNRDALHRLLDRAIELDPDYAAAYALKAEHYAAAIGGVVARSTDLAPAVELERLAVANAERAVGLDPSLANAYAALGLVHRQFWRWPEALAAYAKAYELAPTDPNALLNWVWFNSFARRHDVAIAAARRGVELQAASANAHRDLGLALAYAGQPEPASAALRECAKIDARVSVCHIYLALMQVRLGNPAVAASELGKAEELFGPTPTPATVSSVAHAYSRAGLRADAARLFNRLKGQARSGVVGTGSWPLGYLAVGDTERAFDWLTRAVEKIERHEPDEGFFNLMIIKANVGANPILDEPRFRALRDRIGAL
jgi:tetratricopeptide (TPR) repeat protein